jgi:hypothetical protein
VSHQGHSKGLSRMTRKCPVRFLGEEAVVTPPPYPATMSGSIRAWLTAPRRRCTLGRRLGDRPGETAPPRSAFPPGLLPRRRPAARRPLPQSGWCGRMETSFQGPVVHLIFADPWSRTWGQPHIAPVRASSFHLLDESCYVRATAGHQPGQPGRRDRRYTRPDQPVAQASARRPGRGLGPQRGAPGGGAGQGAGRICLETTSHREGTFDA